MNDLILFGQGQIRLISLNPAHVAVKRDRRKVVGVAPTEEFGQAILSAITDHRLKCASAKTSTLVAVKNIQMIQAQSKILIGTVMIGAKGKISHIGIPVPKQMVMVILIHQLLTVRRSICRQVIMIQLIIRINAPVSLLPDLLAHPCKGKRIGWCCFHFLNHGAVPEWKRQ